MPDNLERCEQCGQVHAKAGTPTCAAHKVVDGVARPCGNYPLRGGTVCRYHGGNAPQVRRAAAQRQQQAAMDRVLSYALKEPEDRHLAKSADEQLLEEVARSYMAVEWLAERVAELKVPDPADQGAFQDLLGFDNEGEEIRIPPWGWLYGPDHQGDLAPHVLWQALDRERDRHAKLCDMAIKAGISERLVRLAESQAQAVVGAILRVIEKLNLDPIQRETARREAAIALRELGPGPVALPTAPPSPR